MMIFWGENSFAISGPVFVLGEVGGIGTHPRPVTPEDGHSLAESVGGKCFELSYYRDKGNKGKLEAIFVEIQRECRAREKCRSVLLPSG
jgi:hypothetical protein